MALCAELRRAGHEVFGIRRSRAPEDVPTELAPRWIRGDLTNPERFPALPLALDGVVFAVSADGGGEAAYRSAYIDALDGLLRLLADEGQRPRRILFTSSTSVYGQSRGEWVDEESPTHPTRYTGEVMLTAERLLASSGHPATVVRLGGIYGPGRNRLIERVKSGAARLRRAPHYSNRIHRDDAAGLLAHLLGMASPEPLYLGVDGEAPDEADVLCWLAERLGVPEPAPADEGDDASGRAGSKRCRNDRIRKAGYEFRYPSFRDGYAAMLDGMQEIAS